MEREKARKLKNIVQAAAIGGTAITLAALARVGERHDNTPSDDAVDVKAFQSGEEQISRARETFDRIVSQKASERSRWEATVKWLANATPLPEPTINIVGEYQALGVAPASEAQVESPVNLAGEATLEKYGSELPRILEIAGANPESFPDLEALQTYYPIYRASGERFGVPWELLYIMHGEESTYSTDPAAFEIISDQYGAMQRNIDFHPQSSVDKYYLGMEYLSNIPVRHFDDSKEINYASAVLDEYRDETGDLYSALFKYSAAGPAQNRWRKYLNLSSLTGS